MLYAILWALRAACSHFVPEVWAQIAVSNPVIEFNQCLLHLIWYVILGTLHTLSGPVIK